MKFGLLECPEIWICEMQAMTESIGTGTMARCVTKPCHFLGVFNACANIVALEKGRHAHEQNIQSGCESDVIMGNSLVDMFAKCASIEDAWRVFNNMALPDVVSWKAMLGGFAW